MNKKLGKDIYQQLEWRSNNTLQLQRLAHEELGCGIWTGGDFPITTTVGETLAVLDISEPDHPKLVNPTLTNTSVAISTPADTSALTENPSLTEDPSSPSPMEDAFSPTIDASPPPPLLEASSSASLKHTSSQESSQRRYCY